MNSHNPRILVVIPARGGSKGIPRKNVRLLNNKPLISYSINTALSSEYIDKVVVSTDDQEIGQISKKYGAEVIFRPENLASDEIPLDPVIFDVVRRLEEQDYFFDIVITIQPTSPLLTKETLDNIISKIINEKYDTVLTAVDDRHLSWSKIENEFIPNYTERKNRQYLPSEFRETGAVLASRRDFITVNSRIGNKISLYEVDKYESIDIDSPMDWWIAEKLLKRKKVVIRVDGYEEIGLGHIYRTLTLASNIMDHEVIFVMNNQHKLGIEIVMNQNYKVETFDGDPLPLIRKLKPNIVINDILDTNKEYIISLKDIGVKIFNFEDLGSGAEFADGVFNALYPGSVPAENFFTGEKYYCARNEFINIKPHVISENVKNVLITFGGTDPNNLTLKTLDAINCSNHEFNMKIILGPGYKNEKSLNDRISKINKNVEVFKSVSNMADFMVNADIIFSSAGRTMYEIAMVGTPAIIIAQNYREMTHLFGHNYNGFINLGLHLDNDNSKILNSFERLFNDYELRVRMNKRMLSHNLTGGIQRVLDIIFSD